ncbi:MAG: hypothetical protein AB6733_09085 [Clostridiaceae bacterium]
MKKIEVFGSILLIGVLFLVFLRFSNSTGETIRIAGKNGLEIVTVRDVLSINEIKEAVISITYINENLNLQSTNDNMIIFNDSEGKYGYIKSPEKDSLKEILSKYIKNDLK